MSLLTETERDLDHAQAATDAGIEARLRGQQDSKASRPIIPVLRVATLHELIDHEFPPREKLLSWLVRQSLNMIHAWRGVGKTHVGLGIAYAVASGGSFLSWVAEHPHKVLLLDGEMPGPALQERFAEIVASSNSKPPDDTYLRIVTPDLQTGAMPDLGTIAGQMSVDAAVQDAELIIVDNLSSLVRSGGRENDAESWLAVAEWALTQRQQGRSVLFIHHSGKNGQQRGTSKREDLLDVVISLKRPADYEPSQGARFEIHFEKARHLSGDEVEPIEATLSTDASGKHTWAWRKVTETTFDKIVDLLNEGLTRAEVADELDVNRSTVSKAAKKAEAQGLVKSISSGKRRGNVINTTDYSVVKGGDDE